MFLFLFVLFHLLKYSSCKKAFWKSQQLIWILNVIWKKPSLHLKSRLNVECFYFSYKVFLTIVCASNALNIGQRNLEIFSQILSFQCKIKVTLMSADTLTILPTLYFLFSFFILLLANCSSFSHSIHHDSSLRLSFWEFKISDYIGKMWKLVHLTWVVSRRVLSTALLLHGLQLLVFPQALGPECRFCPDHSTAIYRHI